MAAALFAHLASDAAVRDNAPTCEHDRSAQSPLPERLLQLARRRLREGVAPPRCYYWWDSTPPVRLDGRAI